MQFLSFLAEPGFVIPWYLFGIAAAAWVWYDLRHANAVLKKAITWAWPIVVLFFAPIGLALYLATARAVTGQTLFVDAGASLESYPRDFVYLER